MEIKDYDAGWLVHMPVRGLLIGQREKLGLSQEEVAKRASIRLEQYQRYEKPEVDFTRSSSARIVKAVCDVLQIDLSYLASGDYCLVPLDEKEHGISEEKLNEACGFGKKQHEN